MLTISACGEMSFCVLCVLESSLVGELRNSRFLTRLEKAAGSE
jgi:hypothetical protein